MSSRKATILLALLGLGLSAGASGQSTSSPDATTRRVLLISVDGLGDDVLDRRDELGLQIPNLRSLMRRGTTAEALRTVLPSATFPAHVSMVTGVSPARHGIQANSRLVPEPAEDHPHTFASEVRVSTLFDRTAEAGHRSAAVWWPLTAEPDFVIVGVGVTGDVDRTRLLLAPRPQGQHGHDPDLRAMEAVWIAAGPGIEAGAESTRASLLDLAPTIARILGVGGFDGPGRVLSAFGAAGAP